MISPENKSKNEDAEPRYIIAGLGEVLWDIFPDNRQLGGAPANFAFHCKQMGANSSVVSCVGYDELGDQALIELKEMGVDTSHISRDDDSPTGSVDVQLDDDGKPTYQFPSSVAWDKISLTSELRQFATTVDAICFGSLGQRSAPSRAAIQAFVKATPEKALRIFDVNLRQNFYNCETISDSLQIANVLKVSDEELPTLADYFSLSGSIDSQLTLLREKFALDLIAYTRGGDGSILNGVAETDVSDGFNVDATDSVGAGDSFTAALCTGLLRGWPLKRVNLYANLVAGYVCTEKGATPKLPAELLQTEVH
ncbi:carbohydrate kinase [Puniceicoccaceae bacterium K14]|nr:carbohydrate kinase [Puniceicoccaceae bacterium K14]